MPSRLHRDARAEAPGHDTTPEYAPKSSLAPSTQRRAPGPALRPDAPHAAGLGPRRDVDSLVRVAAQVPTSAESASRVSIRAGSGIVPRRPRSVYDQGVRSHL